MALTVEDGTGVAGADSYETLAAVDAFQAARGNLVWAAVTTAATRETAIRRAADYLDVWHVSGEPLNSLQGLAFPFLDDDETSTKLKKIRRAVSMLAPIALSGDLVARAPDTAQVISSTDTLGDLSESRTYVDRSNSVTLLNGIDVSFLGKILQGFAAAGGLVIGTRFRA